MPTPFSTPPFQGQSSAVVNAVRGLANVMAGYTLVRYTSSRIRRPVLLTTTVFAAALAFTVFFSISADAALTC